MKRKREILSELNVQIEPAKKLQVQCPNYFICEVCSSPVTNYELCNGNFIYCSEDCYTILYLAKQNRMLHEKCSTFESEMKRSPSQDKLDEDQMSVDSGDSYSHSSSMSS